MLRIFDYDIKLQMDNEPKNVGNNLKSREWLWLPSV